MYCAMRISSRYTRDACIALHCILPSACVFLKQVWCLKAYKASLPRRRRPRMKPDSNIHLRCRQSQHIHSSLKHQTGQDRTGQHSTAQHSAGQDRTGQDRTAQHSTAQHSTAQHSTAQHSTAQHSPAQHSTARHSTAQHSNKLKIQEAAESTCQ